MTSDVPPSVCPSCGAPVSAGARFCGSCGAGIPIERTCQACGARLPEAVRFCSACGAPAAPAEAAPPPPPAAPPEPAPAPPPPPAAAPPPPPVSVSGAPQPAKGKGGVSPVLVGVVVLVLIGIGVAVAFGLGLVGGGEEKVSTQASPTPVVSNTGGAKVGFAGGTVSMEGGPEIEIPAGAIAADSGDVSVTVSKSTQKVVLPGGLKTVGDTYEIGPAGVTFTVPVRITLPIPEGQDPEDVLGVVTLDPDSGEWVSVSSSVDIEARTVSAYVTHLSPWGIVGGRSEAAKTGGWIKVVNTHPRGYGNFPAKGFGDSNCDRKPVYLENLVCFTAYNPQDPTQLMKPTFNTVIARDQTTIEYWLTAGTYTLEDSKFASEINNAPLYSPCMDWWTRPPQTIVLTPGMTVQFGEDLGVPPDPASGFVHTPNSCAPVHIPKATPSATPKVTRTPTPKGTPSATPKVTRTPTPKVTPTPSAAEEEFFRVGSLGVAYNGATEPTTFSIDESWLVTYLITYHWNGAEGATPGTVGLRASDGTTYGPWQAAGGLGQGGVPNAYWEVKPNIVIPPGTYTVLDSDPSTWAQNEETGGAGMSWGNGIRQGNP